MFASYIVIVDLQDNWPGNQVIFPIIFFTGFSLTLVCGFGYCGLLSFFLSVNTIEGAVRPIWRLIEPFLIMLFKMHLSFRNSNSSGNGVESQLLHLGKDVMEVDVLYLKDSLRLFLS